MTNDNTMTTPVNVIGAPVTNTTANHAEKPKKFNEQNFKRWQQKMFFYLTTLNLARFLKETAPQVEPPKEGYVLRCWIIEGESYPYLVGESRVRVCSHDGLIPIIRQVFQYKVAMEPVREAPTWGREPYRKYH
ncbi:hypothetical protein Tco_0071919 [Tanacetum coccineum]